MGNLELVMGAMKNRKMAGSGEGANEDATDDDYRRENPSMTHPEIVRAWLAGGVF